MWQGTTNSGAARVLIITQGMKFQGAKRLSDFQEDLKNPENKKWI